MGTDVARLKGDASPAQLRRTEIPGLYAMGGGLIRAKEAPLTPGQKMPDPLRLPTLRSQIVISRLHPAHPRPSRARPKAGLSRPGLRGCPWKASTHPRFSRPVPTWRIAPVARRTPTLAGGPTGDGSRENFRGGEPPEKPPKKGEALRALAAGGPREKSPRVDRFRPSASAPGTPGPSRG